VTTPTGRYTIIVSAALVGDPAGATVGNTKSSTGLFVAATLGAAVDGADVGDDVSPTSVGNRVGAKDGMSVG
jgi:hypothetical protein